MEFFRSVWLFSSVSLAIDEILFILAIGTIIRICGWRIAGGLIIVIGRSLLRNVVISLVERIVVERLIRCVEVWSSVSSRFRFNVRCVLRLLFVIAWILLIIIVSTSRSVSRAREVSIR